MKDCGGQNMADGVICEYVLNTNKRAMKFHRNGCPCVDNMSSRHRSFIKTSRDSISKEFSPCKICKP